MPARPHPAAAAARHGTWYRRPGRAAAARRPPRLTREDAGEPRGQAPAATAPPGPFLGVPLAADDAVLGALYVSRPTGDDLFSDTDELLTQALADQAGAVVQALPSQSAAQALIDRLRAPASRSTHPGRRTCCRRSCGGCWPPPATCSAAT